jgi:hypothetical protein
LFLFFHKRLCGPLANSRFHHQPDAQRRPDSRLEAAYHHADAAIHKSRRFARRRLTQGPPLLESFSRRFARRRLTRGCHCWSRLVKDPLGKNLMARNGAPTFQFLGFLLRLRPSGVARSGATREWCGAARKPTLTTGWDSLCEVAHTTRGKITIISFDWGDLPAAPGASAGSLGRPPTRTPKAVGHLRARFLAHINI